MQKLKKKMEPVLMVLFNYQTASADGLLLNSSDIIEIDWHFYIKFHSQSEAKVTTVFRVHCTLNQL